MEELSRLGVLMQTLRINNPEGPIGLLAVEVLAHVAAQGPLRLDELSLLTGAANGSLTRAIRSLTVWYCPSTGKVNKPNLPLLQRRKTPARRGYRIHLTCNGRKLLEGVGLPSA